MINNDIIKKIQIIFSHAKTSGKNKNFKRKNYSEIVETN